MPHYECRPILYSSYASDTSWRVRLALAWKNIEYDTQFIDMAAGEHVCIKKKKKKLLSH